MNRIQRVSKFFRILFQVLLVGLPTLYILAWALWSASLETIHLLGGIIHFCFIPQSYLATVDHGTHILHNLSITEKMLAAGVSAIPLAVTLYIIYSLVKLFKLYERGEIFSMENVRYIRNIGYAILVGQIINPFYQAAIGFILTVGNPPGQGYIAVGFDQTNIETILTALMVILISWIMAEGYKLREDQQLTI